MTLSSVKTQAQTKRIHSVTIKRMMDEAPDTSWLGEYASKPSSEFSIDREHDSDCDVQFGQENNCVHCQSELTESEDSPDVLVDETGGDVCPVASLDPNENRPHEITACTCGGNRLDRGEYRYFNPSFNYVDISGKPTGMSAEDVRKYTRQDYERMESLNRGDFSFIGIRAEAEILIPDSRGSDSSLSQRVTSGGLWGIESDSDASYFEKEQLSELRGQLESIGFSKRAVSAAFRNVRKADI